MEEESYSLEDGPRLLRLEWSDYPAETDGYYSYPTLAGELAPLVMARITRMGSIRGLTRREAVIASVSITYDALERWEGKNEAKFTTYLWEALFWRLIDLGIEEVGTPKNEAVIWRKWHDHYGTVAQELQRTPTLEELKASWPHRYLPRPMINTAYMPGDLPSSEGSSANLEALPQPWQDDADPDLEPLLKDLLAQAERELRKDDYEALRCSLLGQWGNKYVYRDGKLKSPYRTNLAKWLTKNRKAPTDRFHGAHFYKVYGCRCNRCKAGKARERV